MVEGDSRRPRVLVLWYSQSGQLKRAAEAFAAPLSERGFDVTWQKLEPRSEFPFPWSVGDFLKVFPDTVGGQAASLEPPAVTPGERFDLVVVAYTVWYLSPSLPAQGLFASPLRAVLRDTPVVTLIACRNMWVTAEGKMRRLIAGAGGRHAGTVALTDDGPAWATLVTTPKWLLTGSRAGFLKIFPPAGISAESIAAVKPFAATLADRFDTVAAGRGPAFDGLDTMSVDRPMVLPDIVIGRLFRPAARALSAARAGGGAGAGVALGVFGLWLVTSVVVTVATLALAQIALSPITRRIVDRRLAGMGVRTDAVSAHGDVDVVVAGGGPVGLSCAILLGRLGVSTLLAERRPSTCTHPKATVLNTRTMELFRLWGMEDEVRERGLPIEHSTAISWVTALDGHLIGQLDLLAGGAKLDEWLGQSPTLPAICAQDELEPVLRRCAEGYPAADVRFATEVTGFQDRGDGVEVELADARGTRRVRARWLVAADGSQSATRRRLGIGSRGTGSLGRLVNIYFHADLRPRVERFPSVLYWVVSPRVHGVIHSLDGAHRWLLNAFVDRRDDTTASWTTEVCERLVRDAVGDPELAVEVRSIKPWAMTAQVAESFRAGNVVLAGDCAHEFPPTGGFGLNTGVQDAHNLAWKLAGVTAGWATSGLVDTYEAERRPVVRMNADQTVLNARNIMEMLFDRVTDYAGLEQPGERGDELRGTLAAAIPQQREHFDFQGEALGAVYRSGAVAPDGTSPPRVANPVTDYVPSAHPGVRAPHAWVTVNGAERSTIDLFDGRFVLLAGPEATGWHGAAAALAERRRLQLDALRLGVAVQPVDGEAGVLELFGISSDGGVLVRPDGHVAWRSRAAAVGDPERELGAVLDQLATGAAGASRGGNDERDHPGVATHV